MKMIFLAIIFNIGVLSSHDNSAPYVGKWSNISNSSSIKEVLFFPDNKVKFSNQSFSILQNYSLKPHRGKGDLFTGSFQMINVGKVISKSSVKIKILEDRVMELQINDKKLILTRY